MEKEKQTIIKVRAIILHEGKLLVVKHPHDPSFVALPGGHLEWGEDLKECVKREIIEELGVEPEIGRLLYVNTFIQIDNKQYVEFFFEVNNGNGYLDCTKNNRTHASEIAEIIWIDQSDNVRIMPKQLGEDFKRGDVLSNELRYIKN